jgi:hypothetical protein
MDRMKQIDAELADQIEELHLEMAMRANDAIAKHKETIAEIEKEKAALEQMQGSKIQALPQSQGSKSVNSDYANGFHSSSSSYNGRNQNPNPGLAESAAFGTSTAFGSSAFESRVNPFQSAGSAFESEAFLSGYPEDSPAMLRAESNYSNAVNGDEVHQLTYSETFGGDAEESEVATEAATDATHWEEEEEGGEEEDELDEGHHEEDLQNHSEAHHNQQGIAGPLNFFANIWSSATSWVPGYQEEDEEEESEDEGELTHRNAKN